MLKKILNFKGRNQETVAPLILYCSIIIKNPATVPL